MDFGLDALLREVLQQRGPPLRAHHVELESVAPVGRSRGQHHLADVAQARVDAGGDLDAPIDPRIDTVKHVVGDDRLHRLQPLVNPPRHDLVAARHAVVAVEPQPLAGAVIARGDGAAVAPDVQRLERVHAEPGRVAPRSRGTTIERAAGRRARILDHAQTSAAGDVEDRGQIRRQAGPPYGQHRLRTRRDRGVELRVVDRELVVHVHEDGPRAHRDDGADGRVERVDLGDDLVTRPDAERLEGEDEGVGAGVGPDDVAGADHGTQPPLELEHGRADRELARADERAKLVEDRLRLGGVELAVEVVVGNLHGR